MYSLQVLMTLGIINIKDNAYINIFKKIEI